MTAKLPLRVGLIPTPPEMKMTMHKNDGTEISVTLGDLRVHIIAVDQLEEGRKLRLFQASFNRPYGAPLVCPPIRLCLALRWAVVELVRTRNEVEHIKEVSHDQ